MALAALDAHRRELSLAQIGRVNAFWQTAAACAAVLVWTSFPAASSNAAAHVCVRIVFTCVCAGYVLLPWAATRNRIADIHTALGCSFLVAIQAVNAVNALDDPSAFRFLTSFQETSLLLVHAALVNWLWLRPWRMRILSITAFLPSIVEPLLAAFTPAGSGSWEFEAIRNGSTVWLFSSYLTSVCIFLAAIVACAISNASYVAEATQEIDMQSKLLLQSSRAQALLEAAVPVPIARQLALGAAASILTRSFPSSCIAFIVMSDFESIVDTLHPNELMNTIAGIWDTFDRLLAQYDEALVKVETVMGCYVVAALPGLSAAATPSPASLPRDRRGTTNTARAPLLAGNHAAIADFCVSVLEHCRGGIGGAPANVKIGINAGPVIAGVIGNARQYYRLFGDTMNVASRMMSTAPVNTVQASQQFVDNLAVEECSGQPVSLLVTPRGQVAIKGKGLMNTSFIVRPHSQILPDPTLASVEPGVNLDSLASNAAGVDRSVTGAVIPASSQLASSQLVPHTPDDPALPGSVNFAARHDAATLQDPELRYASPAASFSLARQYLDTVLESRSATATTDAGNATVMSSDEPAEASATSISHYDASGHLLQQRMRDTAETQTHFRQLVRAGTLSALPVGIVTQNSVQWQFAAGKPKLSIIPPRIDFDAAPSSPHRESSPLHVWTPSAYTATAAAAKFRQSMRESMESASGSPIVTVLVGNPRRLLGATSSAGDASPAARNGLPYSLAESPGGSDRNARTSAGLSGHNENAVPGSSRSVRAIANVMSPSGRICAGRTCTPPAHWKSALSLSFLDAAVEHRVCAVLDYHCAAASVLQLWVVTWLFFVRAVLLAFAVIIEPSSTSLAMNGAVVSAILCFFIGASTLYASRLFNRHRNQVAGARSSQDTTSGSVGDSRRDASLRSILRTVRGIYSLIVVSLVAFIMLSIPKTDAEPAAGYFVSQGDFIGHLYMPLALAASSPMFLRFRLVHALQTLGIVAIGALLTLSLTPAPLATSAWSVCMVLGTCGITCATCFIRERGDRALFTARVAAEAAERDADYLLRNLLPPQVAADIQAGREVASRVHPRCAILFLDLVGFTQLAADMAPADLMAVLNTLYSRFDELVEARPGLWKAETIGDAYIVVGGLFEEERTVLPTESTEPGRHVTVGGAANAAAAAAGAAAGAAAASAGAAASAEVVSEAAARRRRLRLEAALDLGLAMQRALAAFRTESGLDVRMRVGVHAGDVTAGMLGSLRPRFAVLGRAIAEAERVQGSAETDAVRCSAAVFDACRASAQFGFSPAVGSASAALSADFVVSWVHDGPVDRMAVEAV